ncbi:hypothetical protein SDC9_72848 [bioreactor metagenome]|uniref:Uncharacterized protein n=2 Tax=root TaxID=1 RepID=A0AB38BH22_9LACT|nr:hypothetical protein [Trichococcus flocculiformis]CZQ83618.1 Hypothetical protein TFLO_411 [Trichococcus flocculiformis]SFH70622.1 hypothetical protein SAMN04488507_101038 [Trichococcus flocculiformis]
MKRQNLGDLNGYLFEQLERLNEPDMSEAELRLEFERSVRVEGVASEIVKVGRLALDAQKAMSSMSDVINPTLPPMLEADTADTIN